MRKRNSLPSRSRQRGAALVIGLILLVMLTLLAVSGMNTASTELVMAGNEQYRQQAFQASGTGVERALLVLASVPTSKTPTVVPEKDVVEGKKVGRYTTSSQYLGDDLDLPGFSSGKFIGFHYEITSTGKAARGAQSQQRQGAFVIQNAGGGGEFTSIVPPAAPTGTGAGS